MKIISEPYSGVLKYCSLETDYGTLYVACSDIGCVFCGIGEIVLERLRKLGYSLQESQTLLMPALEIASAISGEKDDFSFDIHLAYGTPFQQAVWVELANTSRGSTTTYSQIATKVGRPNAVRAVGSAVGDNPILYALPCHRVLRSDGGLGGFYYGTDMKRKWLEHEGHKVKGMGA